ncbi:MAG: hypothetical protein HC875_03155 [Anaerolineales bacterium]|nr:hypothetical protein [Anaerolineales bacterium]
MLQRFLHWLSQPTLWETFTRGAQAYTVGEYMPPAEALPLVLVFVAVYLLGLIYAARRRWGVWRGPEMLVFLLAFTVAPRSPAPLLLATLLPATLILAALLTINGYALWQHYFNPAYAKDDWRAVIRKIEAFELPVYRDFLLPATPSPDRAIQILAGIAAKHRRIWYTPYGVDLDPPLELTWQTVAPLPADYQPSLRLLNSCGDIFTQSDWPPLSTSTWPPNQPITDRRGLWLPADLPPSDYALQLLVYNPTPGENLGQPLTLYWQSVTEMKTAYTVFVQLLNGAGQVVAQVDAQPLAGAAPTTWLPGEILTDPYTLTLPADSRLGIIA